MNITRKTMSNPVLIVVVFALVALTGLFTFSNLEVNLMPNIKEPILMVMATYENAGPQSVETAVTQVLEEELSSLSNLKKMTSTSSEGNQRHSSCDCQRNCNSLVRCWTRLYGLQRRKR